jgi:hypothetical protein
MVVEKNKIRDVSIKHGVCVSTDLSLNAFNINSISGPYFIFLFGPRESVKKLCQEIPYSHKTGL